MSSVTLAATTTPNITTIGDISPEQFIIYCARVSNPDNQDNHETHVRLLKYLIKNKHWSPFEMASMCVEITTSRAIAQQILRHRSFSFQEFSQRYAEATEFEGYQLRKQADKNRQSSSELIDIPETMKEDLFDLTQRTNHLYRQLLNYGVAKECARFILPLHTTTRMYMHGTVRSWIHYLEQRTDEHTQLEHRAIAAMILNIFRGQFPATADAVFGPE